MHKRVWRICGLAVVALLFVLGNRLIAEILFENMEEKILSDMGSLRIETASDTQIISDMDSDSWSEPTDSTSKREQTVLTEEQIANVLKSLEYSSSEVLHEPLDGQISMEQAIEQGKSWLWEMLQNGSLPDSLYNVWKNDGEKMLMDSAVAVLFTSYADYTDTEIIEPYCSVWKITFSCYYGTIELLLNAVTGQVWRADMTFVIDKGEEGPFLEEKDLEKFVQLAGMHGYGFMDRSEAGPDCFETGNGYGWVEDMGLIYAEGSCVEEEDTNVQSYFYIPYMENALTYGIEVSAYRMKYMLYAE